MYRHVLVTLDGSPASEAVVPHATDMARVMGAKLTLLRVVDSSATDWGERGAVGKGPESTIASLFAEQAETYLKRIAAQIQSRGVTVDTEVRRGMPAKRIVEAVRDLDVDAIAMATHSRRGINRLMFGSVAEQVLYEASLPVLLIRAA
jgi:nucleotide-binding universal stress UspA family protein